MRSNRQRVALGLMSQAASPPAQSGQGECNSRDASVALVLGPPCGTPSDRAGRDPVANTAATRPDSDFVQGLTPDLQEEERQVFTRWREAYGKSIEAGWYLGHFANKVGTVHGESTQVALAQRYRISKSTLYRLRDVAARVDVGRLQLLLAIEGGGWRVTMDLLQRFGRLPANQQDLLLRRAQQTPPSTAQFSTWMGAHDWEAKAIPTAEQEVAKATHGVIRAIRALGRAGVALDTVLQRRSIHEPSAPDIALTAAALRGAAGLCSEYATRLSVIAARLGFHDPSDDVPGQRSSAPEGASAPGSGVDRTLGAAGGHADAPQPDCGHSAESLGSVVLPTAEFSHFGKNGSRRGAASVVPGAVPSPPGKRPPRRGLRAEPDGLAPAAASVQVDGGPQDE